MFTNGRSGKTKSKSSLVHSSLRPSAIVCVLQTLVAITSSFLLAVNLQRYSNKHGDPSLSEMLRNLDGVTLGRKTNLSKSAGFHWPARKFLSGLSLIAKWCSLHYTTCLLISFIAQVFVIFILERKWCSKRSVICLFWLALIIFSVRQRSQQLLLYNMLLSAVICAFSLYLFLTVAVGDRMFGQRKSKKRKKMDCEVVDNEEVRQTKQEEQQSNAKKLKLPDELDELELAENKLSLDENISSLSLGPDRLKQRKKHNDIGSWFKKGLNTSVGTDCERTESCKNSLIWPARFHLNGVSVCEKNRTNHLVSEDEKPECSGEFSDDEGSLFNKENQIKERNDHPIRHRSRRRMTSFCNLGNVERVILVCSLTLNVVFLWMLINSGSTAVVTP